ncbi:MAG TPA: hypothetical protein VGI74_03905 [Streptosporangiaceae bacterium]|jgi:hypothetical protein
MSTELRQGSTLRQVFPAGDIYAVCDCGALEAGARDYGLMTLSLAELIAEEPGLPAGANVVLFLRHNLVSADLRKRFRQAAVLVVPIASFDQSLEAALYTQKLAMRMDYVSACAQGRYWVDQLTNQGGELVFTTSGTQQPAPGADRTDLVCSFSDSLSAGTWLEPVITPGQWVSVGSICEISMTFRPAPGRPMPYTLNGTAVASGVLVARDPRFTEDGDRRIKAAGELRRELVAAGPVSLRLENSMLTEVRASGKDFTDAVREATNPDYDLRALELGIGTNESLLPQVEWQFNSQMNEGAGPVHLGFGEGLTGAHMDFIVAQSAHRFAASL